MDAQDKCAVSIMDRRLKDAAETFASLSICVGDKMLGVKAKCVGPHVSLLRAKFTFLGTLVPLCGDTGPIKV